MLTYSASQLTAIHETFLDNLIKFYDLYLGLECGMSTIETMQSSLDSRDDAIDKL